MAKSGQKGAKAFRCFLGMLSIRSFLTHAASGDRFWVGVM